MNSGTPEEPSGQPENTIFQRFMVSHVRIRAPLAGVLALSLVLLFTVNWLLLRETSRLRTAARSSFTSLSPSAGMRVPELRGLLPSGEATVVSYGQETRSTVLMVFSTTCSLCDANWPFWESIARQIDPTQFRLIYVNTAESLSRRYLADRYFHPDATILARVDPQTAADYSLIMTPIVMLIGADRMVKRVWLGVTKEASRGEMEATLDVKLNGVSTASVATGG